MFFFFTYAATPEISTHVHTLSPHDALPISGQGGIRARDPVGPIAVVVVHPAAGGILAHDVADSRRTIAIGLIDGREEVRSRVGRRIRSTVRDRKSTRLNSSH